MGIRVCNRSGEDHLFAAGNMKSDVIGKPPAKKRHFLVGMDRRGAVFLFDVGILELEERLEILALEDLDLSAGRLLDRCLVGRTPRR